LTDEPCEKQTIPQSGQSAQTPPATVENAKAIDDARENVYGAILSFMDVCQRFDVPQSKKDKAEQAVSDSFDALIAAVRLEFSGKIAEREQC
jgi:hypothetical protein